MPLSATSVNTTPKRNTSKRLSADFDDLDNHFHKRTSSADSRYDTTLMDTERQDEQLLKSPKVPSTPYNHVRRSSTSLGFLATPLQVQGESSGLPRSYSENPISLSPSAKIRLLPPTTPKSKHTEVFLSPSPKLKSPSVYKDNGKPIREISNNLKTRLNYAFVKLQNGWVDKTLSELETELEITSSSASSNSRRSQNTIYSSSSSYVNKFANTNGTGIDIGGADGDSESMSANAAFIKALTSPRKKPNSLANDNNNPFLSSPKSNSVSPLRWTGRTPSIVKKEPNEDQEEMEVEEKPSEVEAIETLMSLSSPKKSKYEESTLLPKRNSSSPSASSETTNNVPELAHHDADQTDIETELDSSYASESDDQN
ncbi:hypothetical protein NCAS_0G00310 [Naumovozyma castellii]|uniref:Uncharacterized protein n=1 Tax=Naumovozyma castellii TaxID=27288 RepID=G0VHN4_NAUCA|nr:hypothetical protein NCAS_0G00310 [Naumovozyma castellii CBS 4309]CCC70918.1 hypothetical protein NCAS_0G00310 [Naumovozyma castellii CBS 4309]